MTKNNGIKSSQQSSNYIDYANRKNLSLIGEGWMFLEDLCASFSISFQKSILDRKFYYVKAPDKQLENLLEYDEYNFLRYDFDKILVSNMRDLLIYGKAYVEKVLWYDADNNLVKISFIPIRYKRQIKIGKGLYYKLQRFDGQIEKGMVDKKNLISFNLKDLGYSKNYFRRKIKRLEKLKFPDTKLSLDKSSGFDFLLYVQKQEYKLLKIMRGVNWYGRNGSNQYISEPYLIYRIMKLSLFRSKFLEYLIKGYNNALGELGREYGFSGEIGYESNVDNYELLLKDLKEGKKNCEEVGNHIFTF